MVRTIRTGDKYGTWESMGLEDKWNTSMRDKGATARSKAVNLKQIGDDLAELKENCVDDFTRSQADKQDAAGDLRPKTLIGDIEKLDKEWRADKPASWRNPFKCDVFYMTSGRLRGGPRKAAGQGAHLGPSFDNQTFLASKFIVLYFSLYQIIFAEEGQCWIGGHKYGTKYFEADTLNIAYRCIEVQTALVQRKGPTLAT